MNQEEARKEVTELNTWRSSVLKQKVKCHVCGGGGRQYAPLHGDPALGYADAGQCWGCEGTGVEKNTKLTTEK